MGGDAQRIIKRMARIRLQRDLRVAAISTDFSPPVQVAANAVAPDGDEFFGLREVQHELRGSEPKSRGTGPVTAIAVRGEWRRAGWLERLWGRSESLIVEHHHGYIMWNGRVEWDPVRSPSLGGSRDTIPRGMVSDHKTWVCPTDGWMVWEPQANSVAQQQQQQLACSAYASPSTVHWVWNHRGGRESVRRWPVRNLDAEFAAVEGGGGEGVVAAAAGGGYGKLKSNATCPTSHSVNAAPPPISHSSGGATQEQHSGR